MQTDSRLQLIRTWLSRDLALGDFDISPASADASFRRYFRVRLGGEGGRSLIVMDAPPDKEDVAPYLKVSSLLAGCGVHVPAVHERDLARGLLLLEDLGVTQLLSKLASGAEPGPLYTDAMQALASIQLNGVAAAAQLDPYSAAVLRREMRLMPDWFCAKHLALELSAEEQGVITAAEDLLIAEALEQPAVFVHRDYHSRNLMVTDERSPGVIDFQDALRGPAAYDLVSILKDCYVAWPRARVEAWVEEFRDILRRRGGAANALRGSSTAEYLRWFDLIGLQRHIKVLGIFARLYLRDGKAGYLADLPRTLEYVRETASRFPELAAFSRFVDTRLVPNLAAANERARQAACE
jgi:aminoglycoside/choline kinase family phosphotransferase